MKCQIQFSEKSKKNIINLSSAEFAHSMLGNISADILKYFSFFWFIF